MMSSISLSIETRDGFVKTVSFDYFNFVCEKEAGQRSESELYQIQITLLLQLGTKHCIIIAEFIQNEPRIWKWSEHFLLNVVILLLLAAAF